MRAAASSARTFFAAPWQGVLRFALAFLAIAWTTLPALAQWRPTLDVEFVVPFGSGGGADLMARVVTKIMTEEKLIPVPVNVNNKPGGGTSVGIAYVANNKHRDPHILVLIGADIQKFLEQQENLYRDALKRLQQGT